MDFFGIVVKTCDLGKKLSPLRRAVAVLSTPIRHSHSSCCLREVSCVATPPNNILPQHEQRRHFLPGLPNPFGTKKNKRLIYSEQTLLGYSMEQMYDIVADVESYPQFVPWCKESVISGRRNADVFHCRLTVGFPPLVEKYTSLVTTAKPHMVRSECFDSALFHHLLSVWKFDSGQPGMPNTCMLDYFVEFEFRSSLHSHLANMFFNDVVQSMVTAFIKRARVVHGRPAIKSKVKKTVSYSPQ